MEWKSSVLYIYFRIYFLHSSISQDLSGWWNLPYSWQIDPIAGRTVPTERKDVPTANRAVPTDSGAFPKAAGAFSKVDGADPSTVLAISTADGHSCSELMELFL